MNVPFAGGAEDGDQAAAGGGQRREHVENLLEGRRRVGIVHDHGERLAAIDPLHPARNALDSFYAGPDRVGIELEHFAKGDGRERVTDVETTRELKRQRTAPTWSDHVEPEARISSTMFSARTSASAPGPADRSRT